jgi:filamentous hemagglutinin family protein
MNKIYRLIWSKGKEMWMAVSEKVAAGWFGRPLTVGTLVLAALLATGGTGHALDPNTLPAGGQIVAGQGSIAQSGSTLTVNQQTERMVAQWNSFNIGANAAVTFRQPGAASVALNRILDQNPSQIFGSLTANGQVFLLNPAGVYFGPTARVDVGGLVASSLNLSNENFLSGNYRFERTGGAGAMINQGTIRTANGGYIAFLSPRITNAGTLAAPGGTVALAAGDRVSLDFTGDKLVNFTVEQGAIDALIENKGLIQADGGMVMLTAQAAEGLTALVVNNEGVIEANTLAKKNGRIVLDGGDAGITRSTGVLSAKGDDPGETGGSVTITGEKVGLFGAASVDVSGEAGGGAVHIGGGFQGKDGTIRNAVQTVVGVDASIKADAGTNGNGGQVVLWSDDYTGFGGRISARGGTAAGDGGVVEVSSRGELNFQGAVDTRAANGTAGELLLDPTNIVVATADPGGGAVSRAAAADLNQFADNPAETSWITPANLVGLLNTAAVTMQAYNDITVADAVNASTNTANYGLTLTAGRSIAINDDITLRGPFTATANAVSVGGQRAAGAGDFTLAAGKKIDTSSHNGAISIAIASMGTMGVATLSNLSSGSGDISLTADSMALIGAAESIAGTGQLTLKPLTLARSILLGADGGAGDLALNTTELAALKETFSVITIGDSSGTGGITFSNAFPLHASRINFRNSGAGGSITFDGTASFSVTGAGVRNYFYAGTFTQDPGATLTSVSNIEIYADSIVLNGAANSLTANLLSLTPYTATRPMYFGAEGGAGVSSIDTTEMATMQNSASVYIGGVPGGNYRGGITITGAIPLHNSGLVFYNDGVGGSITLDGTAAISTNNKLVSFYAGSGNAGAFTQAAGATISTGSGALTISADSIVLNGAADSLVGTGALTLLPKTTARPIVLGVDGAATDFSLNNSELSNLGNTFSGITIGSASLTGGITIANPVTIMDPLTLRQAAGGAFTVNATPTVTGALTFAGAAPVALNASVAATAGVSIGGAVTVGADDLTVNAGTGTATFSSTVAQGANHFTVTADNVALSGNWTGTGSRTLQPTTIAQTIGLAGGAGTFNLSAAELGYLKNDAPASVTIGRTDGTGAIAGGAFSFDDPLVLRGGAITQTGDWTLSNTLALQSGTGNNITLNRAGNDFGGAVSVVSGNNVSLRDSNALALGASTVSGNLTLQAGGALTQSGALAVTGTTAITAGANDVTLDRAGNDFGGAVSIASAKDITLNDSNAMSLGAISATGTVDIATLTNDLTLTGSIDTTDATADAIKLNAGKSATAGTAAGGNLIVSGGTVTTGAGGRATLYTGGVPGSTGLTALVGSGSGRFRYNSDETAANYTTPLGAGSYAVYREQPTVTTTASDASKTYDGLAYSGGNGAVSTGFVNGDTSASLGGALTYGGTSQGAVNAGSYVITPGGYSNGRGYALAYANGTLEITGSNSTPEINGNSRSENIHAGITSPQNNINGTGQNQGASQGAPSMPILGPGAGSASLAGLAAMPLVTLPPPGTGNTVLTAGTFSTPVTMSSSGATATLAIGFAGAAERTSEICALPVFRQQGGGTVSPQGQFVMAESGNALFLTRTGEAASMVAPAVNGGAAAAPFTLCLENGMNLQLHVEVTAEGVLVVTAPTSAGGVDVSQAILMGTQVARQELQLDLKSMTSALFVEL